MYIMVEMRGQPTFYDDRFLRYEGRAKSAIFLQNKSNFHPLDFLPPGWFFFLKALRSCSESFILVSKNAEDSHFTSSWSSTIRIDYLLHEYIPIVVIWGYDTLSMVTSIPNLLQYSKFPTFPTACDGHLLSRHKQGILTFIIKDFTNFFKANFPI